MDTITHSLAGALIGHVLSSNKTNALLPQTKSMLCGAIAATFPDIDYITALIDPLLFITYWHRGITHSLIMMPFWALIIGVVIAFLMKQPDKWRVYVFVSAAALISHIVLDVSTSWDLQIFAPISDYRISLKYLFVIDPIVTGIIIAALIPAYYLCARWISLFGLFMLIIYIFSLSIFQQNAVIIGEKASRDHDWQYENIAALPQPFSPNNWKIILSNDSGHWLTFVNLASKFSGDNDIKMNENIFKMPHYYRAKHDLEWIYFPRFAGNSDSFTVWKHPNFKLFRKFAHFPAASTVNISSSDICFWFLDLRFFLPIIDTPFQYGMCRNPNHNEDWNLYRIKNFSDRIKMLGNL